MTRRLYCLRALILSLVATAIWLAGGDRPVQAYRPESTEVIDLVNKATAYLEHNARSGEPGGQALVALALLKTGRPSSHPSIAKAVISCRQLAARVERDGVGHHCYNVTIACIFLAELDAKTYRAEIEALLRGIVARQRNNGCWGYKAEPNGATSYDDTSQSQYGVLSYWAAHVHGIAIPAGGVEQALHWFIRVQDVSGGWTYVARDPGANAQQRQQQGKPSHSMAAAGLSSVYICSHLLGFGAKEKRQITDANSLPGALHKVDSEEERETKAVKLTPTRTNFGAIQSATALGNAWFAKNLAFDIPAWTHYYMYGLERAMSFRELMEGISEEEPDWYNQGVEYLRQTQAKNGSWTSPGAHGSGPDLDTAFAVLFLTRSTKKSIKAAEKGVLISGKSLPKDLTQIRLSDKGQVVDETQTPAMEDLLAMLEDGDGMDELPSELELASDESERAAQIARLRRLAINGSFQARLTAVKTVGRDRSLENVPVLIFALSDPDWRVQKAARDGLRFISRRFEGFGMPEKPGRQEWLAAQSKWKQWYLRVQPDGIFIE